MKPNDYLIAALVAIAVLIITMAASFPMVALYAMMIEPGHPQAFYNEALLWIAPWSSHILGPVLFFAFNYWLARRRPERDANVFALTAFGAYLLIELQLTAAMGEGLRQALTVSMLLSLSAKLAASIAGAMLGIRNRTKP
jgi:hypothetical protein